MTTMIPAQRLQLAASLRASTARCCGSTQSVALDPALAELIDIRASQINDCAFCLDMHWKDARARGESEERLYSLSTWREATLLRRA